ncbi:MAG: hypothetical protein HC916_08115 [Coleofasciculaceae cyanobacterium SM2_1_6]|nr:hypothetical protein [Coleofasciculaceae cyanobacterium SM2_1_6]
MARQPFNNQFNYQSLEGTDPLSMVEKLFLETVTQPEAEFYPWEPSQGETFSYFDTQEQLLSLESILDEGELGLRVQSLFSQLGQCWRSTTQWAIIQQVLLDRFAGIPTVWLESITTAAQGVVQQKISLQDKLVTSVQSLLGQWAEEDLQVLARPLAYAMRGNIEENQVFTGVWEELSPLEQARWSLAIAKAALQALEQAE